MQYRIVVGEVGNEIGHVISSNAKTSQGAAIALGRQLALYGGDGWGRIEVRQGPGYDWQRMD
jgi:hypothetical protein